MTSSTKMPILIVTMTVITVLANYRRTSAKCATFVEQVMLSAFNVLFPQSHEDGEGFTVYALAILLQHISH
jgi:hypothetical protein